MIEMGTTESMSSWESPYFSLSAGSFLTASREIQSSGASDGTDVTRPVPTSGSQKVAGNTGISLWIMGASHIHPIISLPGIVPISSMPSFWSCSFSDACGETIQVSPSFLILLYSTSGLTQKQTCPYTVSGLRVAAMRNSSPCLNLRRVYSCVSALPPLEMSVSEGSTATGPQLGQAGA